MSFLTCHVAKWTVNIEWHTKEDVGLDMWLSGYSLFKPKPPKYCLLTPEGYFMWSVVVSSFKSTTPNIQHNYYYTEPYTTGQLVMAEDRPARHCSDLKIIVFKSVIPVNWLASVTHSSFAMTAGFTWQEPTSSNFRRCRSLHRGKFLIFALKV